MQKPWKYYNGISRRIQTSRNITFDESDTKLFPIPNENEVETPTILLEGENQTGEHMLEQGSTTEDLPASKPTPDLPVEAPEIRRLGSTRTTNRPDYRLLHDPVAKTTGTDRAFISHDRKIVTAPTEQLQRGNVTRRCACLEKAMQAEMDQHTKIGTWELTDFPQTVQQWVVDGFLQ